MRTFNFIDTKFLAINGDLQNTVHGGTAKLNHNFYLTKGRYVIEANIPSVDIQFMTVQLIHDEIVISASIQTISDAGFVFNSTFGSKSFSIPEKVDESNISAIAKSGKLLIYIPISNKKIPRNRSYIDIKFKEEF